MIKTFNTLSKSEILALAISLEDVRTSVFMPTLPASRRFPCPGC